MASFEGRTRWVVGAVAVAVLLAAAGAVVALWQPGSAKGEVAIDLDLPTYADPESSVAWTPKVVNDSGGKLTDVEFTATLSVASGKTPPIQLSDPLAGDEDLCMEEGESTGGPECHRSAEKFKRESCEVPHLTEEAETGVTMTCRTDLDPGGNEYQASFGFHGLSLPMEYQKLLDHPDVVVEAEVSVAGQVLDTAEEVIPVEVPDIYKRITIEDPPQDLPITDPAAKTHDWSFTVVNDTEQDLSGADVEVTMTNTVDLLEFGSTTDGCDAGTTSLYQAEGIVCSDVDIPSGGSVTMEMTANVADGAADMFDEECYPGHNSPKRCRDEANSIDLRVVVIAEGGGEHFAEAGAVCRLKIED